VVHSRFAPVSRNAVPRALGGRAAGVNEPGQLVE
jgi:hypothetical protein